MHKCIFLPSRHKRHIKSADKRTTVKFKTLTISRMYMLYIFLLNLIKSYKINKQLYLPSLILLEVSWCRVFKEFLLADHVVFVCVQFSKYVLPHTCHVLVTFTQVIFWVVGVVHLVKLQGRKGLVDVEFIKNYFSVMAKYWYCNNQVYVAICFLTYFPQSGETKKPTNNEQWMQKIKFNIVSFHRNSYLSIIPTSFWKSASTSSPSRKPLPSRSTQQQNEVTQ